MQQYVIDASIAIKWFCEESGRDEALELLRKSKQGEIILSAPEFIIHEVGNVLLKGKKFDALQVLRALTALQKANIEFVVLKKSTIEYTVTFGVKYGLTFYDASYAALAYELQAFLISENPKDYAKVEEIEVLGLQGLQNMGK
jgi:predicted nucleic acid-binding protein